MEKELQNSYFRLDLPFSATIEDVEARKKALIKVLNMEEKEKNVSKQNEIEQVKEDCSLIIQNIKNNGIPKEECHRFEASNESILGLVIVLVFVFILCFFSFYAFL